MTPEPKATSGAVTAVVPVRRRRRRRGVVVTVTLLALLGIGLGWIGQGPGQPSSFGDDATGGGSGGQPAVSGANTAGPAVLAVVPPSGRRVAASGRSR